MRLIIQPNYQQISCWAASYVAKKINDFKPTAEKPFVLGVPTGGTPLVKRSTTCRQTKNERLLGCRVEIIDLLCYIRCSPARNLLVVWLNN